jgi:hypothetical protein
MIDFLLTADDNIAKSWIKRWCDEHQKKEDKDRRAGKYGQRARVVLDILTGGGLVGGSPLSEERLTGLEGDMKEAKVPEWNRNIIRDVLSKPRSVKQEQAIAARLKDFGMSWGCPLKYSADRPIIRPSGGASASGMANEWLNEVDEKLWELRNPSRHWLLDKLSNGFDAEKDVWVANGILNKLYKDNNLSAPANPGSYDTFGGSLGYSEAELHAYRDKLAQAYPNGIVEVMLVHLKNQPTRNHAQDLMDKWVAASASTAETMKVIDQYKDQVISVALPDRPEGSGGS